MPKRLDLVGMKFGRLEVIESAGKNKSGRYIWNCKCNCGKFLKVRGDSLTTGNNISCGCYRNEILSKRTKNNLIGKRFERLVVLEEIGRSKNRHIIWKCKCDCGKITNVLGTNLLKGDSKSCGCLKNEKNRERSGKNNHFWKGGISFEPYCPKFNKNLKERVRFFFNYECVLCGKSQKENNNPLSVHHIEYYKKSCCDNKLVHFASLCMSCHSKTNHDRERWEAMLHRIIDEIYDGKSYYTKEEYKNLQSKDLLTIINKENDREE